MYSSSQQQRQQQPATQNFYSLLCIHLSHIHFLCAVCSICFRFYSRLRPILSLVCSRFHFPVGASASMRPACNLYAMLPFRSYYFFFFTFVYPTRHTTYFIPFTIPILPALRMKAFYLAKNKSVKSECLNRWYRRR